MHGNNGLRRVICCQPSLESTSESAGLKPGVLNYQRALTDLDGVAHNLEDSLAMCHTSNESVVSTRLRAVNATIAQWAIMSVPKPWSSSVRCAINCTR